jgi:hypothetical protein
MRIRIVPARVQRASRLVPVVAGDVDCCPYHDPSSLDILYRLIDGHASRIRVGQGP